MSNVVKFVVSRERQQRSLVRTSSQQSPDWASAILTSAVILPFVRRDVGRAQPIQPAGGSTRRRTGGWGEPF